ncbi:RNA recognition motif 2 [Helicosporidium sp. ATCC 50920]|nr:RNA recognition motif 2 [Helicosporidium sp. ATCC 50920]|eukprot:KDD71869.1 RNA recognition motif 2 [Helicosporidium sp. ATCC 50920]
MDVERVERGEDQRTTVMIKNIPNKYTQKMLLALIDADFRGEYDFFYLPIDFKNKCNVGYAFINMTSTQRLPDFKRRFDGKRWPRFNSEKICSITYGRIQGKAALTQHFQNSSLLYEDKRCRPMLFPSPADGGAGEDARLDI